MNLNEQVYVVTGASSGFGKAIAKKIIEHNGKVALVARNQEKLTAVLNELDTPNAATFSCDVATPEQVQETLANVNTHFGAINGVINNAGIAKPNKIINLAINEVIAQINTNFLGTVLFSQHAIPLLEGQVNPRIVNISSASAFHHNEMAYLSIYAATKAGVERFTRELSTECQEHNIGVTCIRPGAAMTDFSSSWAMDNLKEAVNAWHRTGPTMNTGMNADHVADAVIHCLSYPQNVAVDLLEVRPNKPSNKFKF